MEDLVSCSSFAAVLTKLSLYFFKTKAPSLQLRSAYIPIMSEEICKQAHNYGSSIQSGMFCAGILDNMIDACEGDSGGPFVCQENDESGNKFMKVYGKIIIYDCN